MLIITSPAARFFLMLKVASPPFSMFRLSGNTWRLSWTSELVWALFGACCNKCLR